MMIINKGSTAFWNPEHLKSADHALGDYLLSLFNTLKSERNFENQKRRDEGLPGIVITRLEGLIDSYFNALYNEIHTLAVLIDMVYYFSNKSDDDNIRHKDSLYIITLVESYFTSLRAIFDYISVVYRVALDEKYLPNIPSSDSFNDILKFVKKESAKDIIPNDIIELFLQYEDIFQNIKNIRDLIIHKGKEPIIYKDNNEYHFSLEVGSIFPYKNVAEDILRIEKNIYPLMPYLSKLTNSVLEFTSNLGIMLYKHLTQKRGQEIKIVFSAYEGVCIPGFIKFLAITNKNILPNDQ